MKTVIVPAPGKIEIRQVETPVINAYKALVKTEIVALCNATDSKLIAGKFPGVDTYPLALGHENAGIVVDVLASFIIPGFGLFLQKRWRESAAFFFSTVLAFLIMPIAAYVLWLCGIYYTLRMDLSQEGR